MFYSSLNILHVVNFLYIHFDLQGICILCNTKFSLMSKCLGTKAIVVKRVHSNVNRIEKNRIMCIAQIYPIRVNRKQIHTTYTYIHTNMRKKDACWSGDTRVMS